MTNQEKLFTIISELFEVPVALINKHSSKETIDRWDSMGTIDLVAQLENAFQIQFDLLEVEELNSIENIMHLLIQKNVSFDL